VYGFDVLQSCTPFEVSELHTVWGQPPFLGALVLKTVLRNPGGQDPGAIGGPDTEGVAKPVADAAEDAEAVAVVLDTGADWVNCKGPL